MSRLFLIVVVVLAAWGGSAVAAPPPASSVVVTSAPSPELQARIDAHPGGTLTYTAAPRLSLGGGTQVAVGGCWSRTFSYSGANGAWLRVSPRWCGYGYTWGVNNSNRSWGYGYGVGPSGTWGPDLWGGCEYGCGSAGYQWVQPWWQVPVPRITLLWELYGNGQSWSYGYDN